MISEKRCPKCADTKAACDFRRDKTRADGMSSWCRDCLNQSYRQWRTKNREREIARSKARHSSHPPDRAVMVERATEWAKSNPDRRRAIVKNCKHKRRAQTAGRLSAGDLREWERTQPKVCHWCGEACREHHIDHLVPLARGGEHALHNLVISCPTCNRRKGARCPVEFAKLIGKAA